MSSVSALRERMDEKKFNRKLAMKIESETEINFYANEDIGEEESLGRKEKKKGGEGKKEVK